MLKLTTDGRPGNHLTFAKKKSKTPSMFDGNPLTFSTVPGIFGGNPLTFSKVPSIFDGNPLTIFKSSKHIRWCVALQSSGMFPGIFSLFSSLGPKHTCLCIAPQSSGIFPGIFSLFLESSATMRPFSHRAFYGGDLRLRY